MFFVLLFCIKLELKEDHRNSAIAPGPSDSLSHSLGSWDGSSKRCKNRVAKIQHKATLMNILRIHNKGSIC